MMKSKLLRHLRLYLLLALIISGLDLSATKFHWVGTSAGNWNDPTNWSATPGGAGGVGVPLVGDWAVFDGVNGSNGNCDLVANTIIDSLVFDGYTGTFDCGSNQLTLERLLDIQSGTFIASTDFVRVDFRFNFISPAATYVHNNGTFIVAHTNANASLGTNDLTGSPITFYNLSFGPTGNSVTNLLNGVITVQNQLRFGGGNRLIRLLGGEIHALGNIQAWNTFPLASSYVGSTIIDIRGTGVQTWDGGTTDCNEGLLTYVKITNKNFNEIVLIGEVGVQSGLENVNSNLFCIDLNSAHQMTIRGSAGFGTLELTGPFTFDDLKISPGVNKAHDLNNTTLVARRTLTFASGNLISLFNGNIDALGNVNAFNTFPLGSTYIGNATININGLGVQTWDGTGTECNEGLLPYVKIVNKSTNELVLVGQVGVQSGLENDNSDPLVVDPSIVHQMSVVGSGGFNDVELFGPFTFDSLKFAPGVNKNHELNNTTLIAENLLTVTSQFLCSFNNGDIDTRGDLHAFNTFSIGGTFLGDAFININGTGTQTWDGGNTNLIQGILPFVNVVDKGAGELVLVGNIGVQRGLASTGTTVPNVVAPGVHTMVFRGGGGYGDASFTGPLTFHDVQILPAVNKGHDFNNTSIFVGNDLTLGGMFLLAIKDGGLEVDGDVYALNNHSNTSPPVGNGYIKIIGNATTQTIFGNGQQLFGRLPNVEINKPNGGVNLDNTVTIDGNLDLVQGIVNQANGLPTDLILLNRIATVSNASNLSHINGPIKKFGNTGIVFPTGKLGLYLPVEISAVNDPDASFTAEYFNDGSGTTSSNDGFAFGNTETSLAPVRDCEYWNVERNSLNGDAVVTLHWGANNCAPITAAEFCNLRVARWGDPTPTQWKDEGFNNVNGTIASGTISSMAQVTNFATNIKTPFTFSTTSNPLAISVVSTTDISCNGFNDGQIVLSASGGTAPYMYSIDNCVTFQSSPIFNNLGAGTYTVCVQDGNGCNTQSTTVTITEPPVLTICIVSEPESCNGGMDGTISITAMGGTSPYMYSIDNCVTQQSTGNFSGLSAGTYIACIQDANGCTVSQQVTITFTSNNCCFASDPQNGYLDFVSTYGSTVNNAGNILVLPNKVYFSVDVTLTDGTLDMTNVDAVFGDDAGLVLNGNAEFRSTNATLRPCDPLNTWDGIRFNANSQGRINENVFKNAENGLDLRSPEVVESTNNEFFNCMVGIRMEGLSGTANSVTGNTFATTDLYPFSNDANGIFLFNSDLDASITRNDFSNVRSATAGINVFGIHADGSSAEVSNNDFVNQYRALNVVNNSSNFVIENNEILVELTNDDDNHQIAVSNANAVWITGNELEKSGFASGSGANVGIIVNRVTGLNLKLNRIQGFDIGIRAIRTQDSNIGENEVLNPNRAGIHLRNVSNTQVNCNTINMDFDQSQTNAGILYIDNTGGTGDNGIRSNCISEATNAIELNGNSGAPLPAITNNHLYNYVDVGLLINGLTGDIGSGVAYNLSGHNTFNSNNVLGGAIDISSSSSLTAWGNYGIVSTGTGITVVGNNLYNSSASCGLQIESLFNEHLQEDLCDRYENLLTPFVTRLGSGFELAGDFTDAIEELPLEKRGEIALWVLDLVSDQPGEAAAMMQLVANRDLLDPNDHAWLAFNYAMHLGDWNGASNALQAISPIDMDEQDRLNLSAIRLYVVEQGIQLAELDAVRSQQIEAIVQRDGKYRNLARSMRKLKNNVSDIIFDAPEEAQQVQKGSIQYWEEQTIELFPNPATDVVSVRYQLASADGAVMKLVDMTGKVILQRDLDYSGDELEIDLDNLTNGVYLISITSPDADPLFDRFVKQ